MEKCRIYGERTCAESSWEKEHRVLARRAAAEGMVLLKNDSVLPIKKREIALYGAGARMTVRGGTGSGDAHERYSVSIEQGLLNAEFDIKNTKWIDRFDSEFATKKKVWKDGIEEKIMDFKMETVLQMFEVIYQYHLPFPTGDKIRKDDLPNDVDTAIYVMARQAGEGCDRKNEPGDFQPDEVELYNIRLLGAHFKKLLLVVNCGGMMDLSCLDELPNIGAVLFFGQGGTEGGNAFADIITGKVTPSGKLTDTWALTYLDYPSADTYAHCDGNIEEENYKEGIYVGYRYFDAVGKKTRFPFGYGLSYTDFQVNYVDCQMNGSHIGMKVQIINTGMVYYGKEVVQLYAAKPQGYMDHEKQALVAFAKTPELRPEEKAEVELSFEIEDVASYDEIRACWFLEQGEYGLFLGNSSQGANPVAVLSVEKELILEQDKNICSKDHSFEDFKPILSNNVYPYELPRIVLDESKIYTKKACYDKPEIKESDKVTKILNSLDSDELIDLCVGGGQFGNSFNMTPGFVGRTANNLLEKGIPNINFADGPAGLNLLTETVVEDDGTQKYLNHMPENQTWGFLREMEQYALGDPQKGTPIYQYMTAWPAVHLRAQTWNVELEEEIGKAIGEEMLTTGISLWLAPALNLHRNPLCGRNFEYCSEDPLLSGIMAAAITRGVQSKPGIGVTAKHFCCNNQETNRNCVSENVSERALRELYLRGFHKLVNSAKPMAIMSSYNKVNGTYVVNSYELLTEVLRCEWGYEGLVMSDWGATGEGKASYEDCPIAGNDLIMPGDDTVKMALSKALENGTVSKEQLKWCAAHVLHVIFDSAVSEGF